MANEEVTRKLGHVERELSSHSTALATTAEQMKNLAQRSDERLDYIKERFDGLAEDNKETVSYTHLTLPTILRV